MCAVTVKTAACKILVKHGCTSTPTAGSVEVLKCFKSSSLYGSAHILEKNIPYR